MCILTGNKPETGNVRWPGIEPATFRLVGQHELIEPHLSGQYLLLIFDNYVKVFYYQDLKINFLWYKNYFAIFMSY